MNLDGDGACDGKGRSIAANEAHDKPQAGSAPRHPAFPVQSRHTVASNRTVDN